MFGQAVDPSCQNRNLNLGRARIFWGSLVVLDQYLLALFCDGHASLYSGNRHADVEPLVASSQGRTTAVPFPTRVYLCSYISLVININQTEILSVVVQIRNRRMRSFTGFVPASRGSLCGSFCLASRESNEIRRMRSQRRIPGRRICAGFFVNFAGNARFRCNSIVRGAVSPAGRAAARTGSPGHLVVVPVAAKHPVKKQDHEGPERTSYQSSRTDRSHSITLR